MIPNEVLTYQSLELSFFPLPYGQKFDPDFKWGQFQERRPTDEEVNKWFGNGHQHNVAVVCGRVSGGLVVLDCDTEKRFGELSFTMSEHGIEAYDTLVAETGKGYHIFLFVDDLPPSAKFPKLDIKSEGGYVVAPPSKHPSGKLYRFINLGTPIKRINSLLDIGIDLNQKKNSPETQSDPDNWVSRAMLGVNEGERDDTCARLAGFYLNRLPPDIVKTVLYTFADKCQPPFSHHEVDKVVNSLARRHPLEPPNGERIYRDISIYPSDADLDSERIKSVSKSVSQGVENVTSVSRELVEEWIKDTNGWFSYEEIDRELRINSAEDKTRRRIIFKRLKDEGLIEPHRTNNKLFRHVQVAVRLVDFKAAGSRTPLDINYPFEIEKYFNTYPGNIIVVAGAADAGKTAFLLNVARLNQDNFSVYYQTSEMGDAELASRLEKFEDIKLEDWNFTAEERSRDFADVIRPDCINIIDYMELAGDFYAVADYLKAIHDKLAGGIAIVALQKKRNAELGRGGDFALEKPRLYLTMDPGKIKIQKAKNWADQTYNPKDMVLKFKLVGGCKFIVTEDWRKEEE